MIVSNKCIDYRSRSNTAFYLCKGSEAMANEENLIKNSDRTPSELREITRKGGLASGKARKKKAELKKVLNAVLTAQISDEDIKNRVEELGFENNNLYGIVFVMMQRALNGDVKAMELISKYIGNEKDEYDISEQKERIKSLKLDNKKKEQQLNGVNNTELVLSDYLKKLEGVLKDDVE